MSTHHTGLSTANSVTGRVASVAISLLVVGTLSAQDVPAELEGQVTNIVFGFNGHVTISVMGVPIRIPKDVMIHTPAMEIEASDLLGDTLPGRDQPGFMGGTGIILASTKNGVTTASDVFVEPAENVLIGEVTANDNGRISILGVDVELIEDWRMFGIAWNEPGFLIDLNTVEVGSFGVAEGYFGNNGVFYAHRVEADGSILGPENQTSITRAICGEQDRLLVRGASTSPFGTIDFYNDETGEHLGTSPVIPDGDNPQFGKYRLDYELGLTEACPRVVRAENSNGSFATSEVEIDG